MPFPLKFRAGLTRPNRTTDPAQTQTQAPAGAPARPNARRTVGQWLEQLPRPYVNIERRRAPATLAPRTQLPVPASLPAAPTQGTDHLGGWAPSADALRQVQSLFDEALGEVQQSAAATTVPPAATRKAPRIVFAGQYVGVDKDPDERLSATGSPALPPAHDDLSSDDDIEIHVQAPSIRGRRSPSDTEGEDESILEATSGRSIPPPAGMAAAAGASGLPRVDSMDALEVPSGSIELRPSLVPRTDVHPETIHRYVPENRQAALLARLPQITNQLGDGPVVLGEDHVRTDARALALDLIEAGRVTELFLELASLKLDEIGLEHHASGHIKTVTDHLRAHTGRTPSDDSVWKEYEEGLGYIEAHPNEITLADLTKAAVKAGVRVYSCDNDPSRNRGNKEAVGRRNRAAAEDFKRSQSEGHVGTLMLIGADHLDPSQCGAQGMTIQRACGIDDGRTHNLSRLENVSASTAASG